MQKYYLSPRISSELMDCSLPLTFDQYNLCSFNCQYCFSFIFKQLQSKEKPKLKSVNIDKLISSIEGKLPNDKYYNYFFKNQFVLHWGGLTDPFCNFELKYKQGQKLIEVLGDNNYPTLFSTKGMTILKDKGLLKLFEKYKDQSNFAFQISIVTNSNDISKQIEIGCPSTSERLELLKVLSDMGYYTILRLRPFILGITDIGLEELLNRSLEVGINAISCEFFALDIRLQNKLKKRINNLNKFIGTDNLIKYFSALSPMERGAVYLRLNRFVKEKYIKIIYKFCIENKLVCAISDPDFKELNTTGSCCGLPDSFTKNPKLTNWTRNQLTNYLMLARKEFHKTGQLLKLKFNDIYKDNYLNDKFFLEHTPFRISLLKEEQTTLNLQLIIQRIWNNTKKHSNPMNYFHGKLLPIKDLDKYGNLIYQYNPMEYETRWKNEGIDLTK